MSLRFGGVPIYKGACGLSRSWIYILTLAIGVLSAISKDMLLPSAYLLTWGHVSSGIAIVLHGRVDAHHTTMEDVPHQNGCMWNGCFSCLYDSIHAFWLCHSRASWLMLSAYPPTWRLEGWASL